MDRSLGIVLTIVAGGLIAAQAPINSKLGHSIGTLQAAAVSFFVGLAFLLAVLAVTGQGFAKLFSHPIPAWYFLGGLLGAFLVTVVLVTVRSLGAGGVTAGLIVGQLVAALAIDRFGWLGVEQHPISLSKVAGVALLAVGTYLVIAE